MARRRRPQASAGADKSPAAASRGSDEREGPGRRTALVVAAIAAAATVTAALIGLLKPDHQVPDAGAGTYLAGPVDRSAFPHITSMSIAETPNSRYVMVKGTINKLLNNTQALYAVAAPVNGEPAWHVPEPSIDDQAAPMVPNSQIRRWYVSPPITFHADGSWEARIDIDPKETRQLKVQAFVITACDVPPLGATNCTVPAVEPPVPATFVPQPIPRDNHSLERTNDWFAEYGPPDIATTSDPATIEIPHP